MMRNQLSATSWNRVVSTAFSSASPPESATPSAFSRKRTSAKRKSASAFCCRKFSGISGRPTRWVSQLPMIA